MKPLKLNLACGEIVLDGWVNLDSDPRVEGAIDCNLLSGLPFRDGTVHEILTSHFLEHLRLRTQAIPFLRECARVLAPGGVLSIITPDFEVLHRVRRFDYHFNRLRFRREKTRWLVGATFGEGRTDWDYHASGWFKGRFEELGHGIIRVDPAAGDAIAVWNDMELVNVIRKWRSHSPYEITAIYRKVGRGETLGPTWINEPSVVGTGFSGPIAYTVNRLPVMVRNLRKGHPD